MPWEVDERDNKTSAPRVAEDVPTSKMSSFVQGQSVKCFRNETLLCFVPFTSFVLVLLVTSSISVRLRDCSSRWSAIHTGPFVADLQPYSDVILKDEFRGE